MNVERGSTALRKAAAARSVSAAGRARGALVDLHGRGATISFASVAARANVSRQFLYSHPDLRAEIERLRSEPQPAPARQQASDESMRTRLRAALDDNKRLRQQIAELRDELALTHGRVRELELATRAPCHERERPSRVTPTTGLTRSSLTCQRR